MPTEKRTEHIVSMGSVFDTSEDADAFRKKLKDPDLYGLYGMYKSEDKQLWVAMPLRVLDAMGGKPDAN